MRHIYYHYFDDIELVAYQTDSDSTSVQLMKSFTFSNDEMMNQIQIENRLLNENKTQQFNDNNMS